IQVGLGQGIGALLLDGILGGQHHERFVQPFGTPENGDHFLLHGLQKSGLGFGRGAIDFVGEEDLGENGPMDESQFPLARGLVFLQDFGAENIRRHQIRSELDPIEIEVQGLAEAVDHGGLGHARHAYEQYMAAAKQGYEDFFQDLVLAHDDLADFLLEPAEYAGNVLEGYSHADFLFCAPYVMEKVPAGAPEAEFSPGL